MPPLIWLSLPPLALAALLLAHIPFANQVQAQPPAQLLTNMPSTPQVQAQPSVQIAQAAAPQTTADFDRSMRQGYQATAKRDYRSALIHFRTAERIRPENRYAQIAIANVNRYIDRYIALGQTRVPLFIASGTGAPINRVAGATRGLSHCLSKDQCLVALLPPSDSLLYTALVTTLLTTASDFPSLLFYVSESPALRLEFRFTDDSGKAFKLSMKPPEKGGLVTINLNSLKDSAGQSLPPLVPGKTYLWDYTLILNEFDRSNSPNVDGKITRLALDAPLAQMLQQASPQDRIALYGANRIWYDLIATLHQERQKNPNNPALNSQWLEVLQTIKLEQFANAPTAK